MPDKFCLTVVVLDDAKTPAEALRRRRGAKLREFREFRELSQSALAGQVGVTKAAVSDWERGKSWPRPHHQVAVAKALGAPWSALFGLDGEAA